MPPKTGLLGTLSAIALGAGISAATPAAAQDQTQIQALSERAFLDLCSWVDQTDDPDELNRIITLLVTTLDQCPTDQVTQRAYCQACLSLASRKFATMVPIGAGIPGH